MSEENTKPKHNQEVMKNVVKELENKAKRKMYDLEKLENKITSKNKNLDELQSSINLNESKSLKLKTEKNKELNELNIKINVQKTILDKIDSNIIIKQQVINSNEKIVNLNKELNELNIKIIRLEEKEVNLKQKDIGKIIDELNGIKIIMGISLFITIITIISGWIALV